MPSVGVDLDRHELQPSAMASGAARGRPRWLALCAAVGVVGVLGGCSGGSDDDPTTTTNASASSSTTPAQGATAEVDDEVRAAFETYRSALLAGDGAAAAAAVSAGTTGYFGEMQELASSAGPEEIGARPMIDRLFVTLVRVRVPRPQLLAMSGVDLLTYGVEEGLVGQETVSAVTLGTITIEGDTADATVVNQGKTTSGRFRFLEEGGAWKVDLLFLLNAADPALRQVAAAAGQDEDEFIFGRVAATTGKPVPPDIWQRPTP